MIVDEIIPIWKNDGTANITVANGNIYAFWPYHGVPIPPGVTGPTAASPNNGFSNADFNIQPNYWFHIRTRGSTDYLVIQYQSKLEAVGTITNVVSNFLTLGLQGKFYSPVQHPSLRVPQVVNTVNLPPIGNTGVPEWSACELKVQRISWTRENDLNFGARFTNVTAASGTEHHNGAIFVMGNVGGSQVSNPPLGAVGAIPATAPNRTPLTTDRPGWALFIHQKNHNVPAGGAVYGYPSLGGIQDVWVNFQFFADWTGAGPIRINGEMHAILLRETGRT